MAGSINKVILIGHLGKDPEMRYTADGSPVANFTIATSENWKDKSGEKQERTEWHKVVAFRKLAEICGEYLRKGKLVYIEGKIQTRKWQDKEGHDRYTTEIVADDMQMLGRREEGGGGGGGYDPPGNPTPPPSKESGGSSNDHGGGMDDDIPF